MGHIQKNLLADEHVVRRGTVSLSAYIAPVLLLFLGILTAVFLIGFVLIIYSIVIMIRLASIEVAVTDNRVIGKVGFIATNSLDLRLAKLEGVSVRRGLFGAMFNYGSITVAGSGQTRITFHGMHNPESLRRAFIGASEQSDLRKSQPTHSDSLVEIDPSPVFEVQILDRASGDESWIQVKARDKEDAIRRAADTGMIAGQCRLISID